jgi:hypothetical protein
MQWAIDTHRAAKVYVVHVRWASGVGARSVLKRAGSSSTTSGASSTRPSACSIAFMIGSGAHEERTPGRVYDKAPPDSRYATRVPCGTLPVPMPLSEEAFTALVDAGCGECQGKKLTVAAIVAQRLPLLDSEIFGEPTWGYKGEDLVRGAYRVGCAACKKELFSASACPLCDASNGIERALDRENGLALPRACATCGNRQLTAYAYVPARIAYDGTRASKARTNTAPEDPGFHAFRIECKECRAVVERREPCPLCGGPS